MTEAERQAKQFLLKRRTGTYPFPGAGSRGRLCESSIFMAYDSQSTYTYRVLGSFDEIFVVEFIPYSDAR